MGKLRVKEVKWLFIQGPWETANEKQSRKSHENPQYLPDTTSVTEEPTVKVPEKHLTVPPAQGNEAECGQRSEGVTEGQGSSAFLRKELWFFVITSLILGDVYNTDRLVKSKAF